MREARSVEKDVSWFDGTRFVFILANASILLLLERLHKDRQASKETRIMLMIMCENLPSLFLKLDDVIATKFRNAMQNVSVTTGIRQLLHNVCDGFGCMDRRPRQNKNMKKKPKPTHCLSHTRSHTNTFCTRRASGRHRIRNPTIALFVVSSWCCGGPSALHFTRW